MSIIAVLSSTIILAQTTVTGTISDDNNDPIPGANIVLDAMNGTVADFDGNFTIVINADARSSEAYNYRGEAQYLLGNFDKALSDFNIALSINPN